jgi:hypothetical protein
MAIRCNAVHARRAITKLDGGEATPSRAWLQRMADAEDRCASIAAGADPAASLQARLVENPLPSGAADWSLDHAAWLDAGLAPAPAEAIAAMRGHQMKFGCKSCRVVVTPDMTNHKSRYNTERSEHNKDATHAMMAGDVNTAGGQNDTEIFRSEPRG